jgi:RNA polymerase sigma factor (sigma-70 family)
MTLLENNRPLLDAFRRGEEWALRTVYREYAPRVARYAKWNFEMSHVDVSETTQLTFIRVFSEPARLSYDGVRPYLNFILRAAHNVAVNELKKAWRRHETLPEAADDAWLEALSPAAEDDAETRAFRAERQALLGKLTQVLDPLERSVLEKRFIEEMTQEAAAEALGLTRQRVRTIERDIRAKAFKIFKTSGYLPARLRPVLLALLVDLLLREVIR